MRSHPERTRGDSLCPVNAVGEGRRTPPNLIVLNPAGLKPALPIPPAAHTLEGWYPRKYAYCTIYRK